MAADIYNTHPVMHFLCVALKNNKLNKCDRIRENVHSSHIHFFNFED